MSSNETSRAPDLNDTAKSDEDRMRTVLLGLGGGGGGGGGRSGRAQQRSTPQAHAPSGRHRFAQDGDVPVVRLSLARPETRDAKRPLPTPEPVTADPLERERAMRHSADRSVSDLTTTLHGVQTRLGHAELDLERATAQLQAREHEIAALRAELRAREQELAAARRGDAGRRRPAPETPAEPDADGSPPFAAPVHDGVPGHDAPEPVKWWRD